MKSPILPNFFIIGAAKAGTTSFAEYLSQHPDVYISPIKEPHYFSSDIDCDRIPKEFLPEEYFAKQELQKIHTMCVRQPAQYERLFEAAGNAKAIGEASVSYLFSEVAPARIADEIRDARILVFLRNPVERAFSHFQMDASFGSHPSNDFVKAVEKDFESREKGWGVSHLYVELGLYVPQLKRFLRRFPRERLKILFHDDYRTDVRPTLLGILSFLGVPGTLDKISVDVRRGEAAQRRPVLYKYQRAVKESRPYRLVRETIPPDARRFVSRLLSRRSERLHRRDYEALIPYFREDILELSDLVGRDLSNWLLPRAFS